MKQILLFALLLCSLFSSAQTNPEFPSVFDRTIYNAQRSNSLPGYALMYGPDSMLISVPIDSLIGTALIDTIEVQETSINPITNQYTVSVVYKNGQTKSFTFNDRFQSNSDQTLKIADEDFLGNPTNSRNFILSSNSVGVGVASLFPVTDIYSGDFVTDIQFVNDSTLQVLKDNLDPYGALFFDQITIPNYSTLKLVDSTRLTQDSILVYYQNGVEVDRDTLPSGGSVDLSDYYTQTQVDSVANSIQTNHTAPYFGHYNSHSSDNFSEVNNSLKMLRDLYNVTLPDGKNAYQEAEVVAGIDAYTTGSIKSIKGTDLPYKGATTSYQDANLSAQTTAIDDPAFDYAIKKQYPAVKLNSSNRITKLNSSDLGFGESTVNFEFSSSDTITTPIFKLSTPASDTIKSADFGSGAVAAYSLEPITAGYTGKLIEVTRSSDNSTQEFDSTEIADGTLAIFVGTGNIGYVTKWIDQVDTFDLLQIDTSEAGIIYRGDSLVTDNGFPAIHFNADYMRNQYLMTTGQTASVFFTGNVLDATGDRFYAIYSSYDNTGDQFALTADGASLISNADLDFRGLTVWIDGFGKIVADKDPALLTLRTDGTTAYFDYNGNSKDNVAIPSGTNFEGLSLFDLSIGIEGRHPIGFIQEFIIYDEYIGSELLTLENSINNRYNLTNNITPIASDSIELIKSQDSLFIRLEGADYAFSEFETDKNYNIALSYNSDSVFVSTNGIDPEEYTVSYTQAYNSFSFEPTQTMWLYKFILFNEQLSSGVLSQLSSKNED